jgi:carbonic anhydrase/acetyltransferase-like protein (isoleucine patch superfamily)
MAIYRLDGIAPSISEESCWIAPSADIIGRVELLDGVSVWFGAVLRGDNEPVRVGARTNIQEFVVVHTDPGFPVEIGEGCTIGHRAIVHGATVGANTLIGMGAIILNGARIGRNCLVGAGSLIAENKEIPDNSLVIGAPARIVRKLGDAEIEALRRSAEAYVGNARRFAAGLERV